MKKVFWKAHLQWLCRLSPSRRCESAPEGTAPKRGIESSESWKYEKLLLNKVPQSLPCMFYWDAEGSTWRWHRPRTASHRLPDVGIHHLILSFENSHVPPVEWAWDRCQSGHFDLSLPMLYMIWPIWLAIIEKHHHSLQPNGCPSKIHAIDNFMITGWGVGWYTCGPKMMVTQQSGIETWRLSVCTVHAVKGDRKFYSLHAFRKYKSRSPWLLNVPNEITLLAARLLYIYNYGMCVFCVWVCVNVFPLRCRCCYWTSTKLLERVL